METIIRTALRLRGLVLVVLLAVIGFGVYQYLETPRDAFPDISPVMVPIFAEAPGLAAEEVGGVDVIDSCSLSTGIGLLVLAACEMIQEGKNEENIKANIDRDLTNLVKEGEDDETNIDRNE